MKSPVSYLILFVLCGFGLSLAGCQSTPPADSSDKKTAEATENDEKETREDDEKTSLLAPEDDGTEDGPDSTSGNDALDDIAREMSLKEQERRGLADHYYKTGKQLFAQLKYEDAVKHFRRANKLDPTHEKAKHYLALTEYILGERHPEFKITSEHIAEQKKARIGELRHEIRREFDMGQEAYNKGDYEIALKHFERVQEIIRWFPYEIDTENLEEKSKQFIVQTKQQMRKAAFERQEEQEAEALRQAMEAEARRQEREQRRIDSLLEKAVDHMKMNRFQEAEALCDQVLRDDPTNRAAKKLKDLAVSARHRYREKTLYEQGVEASLRDTEELRRSGVPIADYVTFPDWDSWKEKEARSEGIAETEFREEPWVVQLKNKLAERKVNLNFPDVPLTDVVSFIQDMTGINFYLDRPNLETPPEDIIVNMKLEETPLKFALDFIMDQTGLTYIFRNQAIVITEKTAAKGRLIFEIYNVPDILNKIADFPGPRIEIPQGDAAAGGGAADSFDFGGGDEDLEKTIDPDRLIDLIQQSTGDDAWPDEGDSIEYHRGQLLVVNTRQVHEQVRELLQELRKNSGLFVNVETRFIDVMDDLLWDVGVDYRGLGRNTTSTPPGNTTFGTPGTLQPNNSGGTNIGFGRQIPSQQLPNVTVPRADDVTGRVQHIFDGLAGPLTGQRLVGGNGLTLGATWLDPFQVSAILRMEEEHSKVKLVTAPQVTAANRERVHISVITQRAYIADYELSSGGTGLQVVEVADPIIQTFQEGVVLDVRPTISYDRKYVTLDVRPTLATLVGGQISTIQVNLGTILAAARVVPIFIPEIQLDEAWTSVTIPDGGTALLGGFRSINERQFRSGLPLFDHIPILNVLFKREGAIRETRSLVILITARIIDLREEERRRFNPN